MALQRQIQRDLEHISAQEKINHLIKNHLIGKVLYVADGDPPNEVKLLTLNENNMLTVDTGSLRLEETQDITLFRILGRYVHLDCTVIRHITPGNQYNLHVTNAAIAKRERSFSRIGVPEGELVMTNVRASKHMIDATLYNIPTTVKVNFASYEQRIKSSADYVKVDVFGPRGTLFDEIRKSSKTLLLSDTQNLEAYKARTPFYFEYGAYLDDKLQKTMQEYRRAKIVSEIIVPIHYITHDQSSIPLGYIHMQSKSKNFDEDKVLELQQMAFEMVDRIRDSNTVLIQEKQKILNFSRGGVKALITHPDLREYLGKQSGFTFDLLWRMQAPITLYGLIRSAVTNANGHLMLGVQISGNSSREGEMKRFLDNVIAYEKRVEDLQKKAKPPGK
ncbi:MAG: DUF1577 domain-containing protein [Spirochaetia bacterium]|nr:DUF1577 domain-containing protein [Spirochaetia bacterium]